MEKLVVKTIEAAATSRAVASLLLARGEVGMIGFESQTGSGTWSIFLRAPTRWMVEQNGGFWSYPEKAAVKDPYDWIRKEEEELEREGESLGRGLDGELPFAGGLAGYLSFEFGWHLDEFSVLPGQGKLPELFVGVYESGLIYDHRRQVWRCFGPTQATVDGLEALLLGMMNEATDGSERKGEGNSARDVSGEEYQRRVAQSIEAIREGEFFEVNYTERFHGRWRGSRQELYEALRENAPGDYGGYVSLREGLIASISPEQFLQISRERDVLTRPIKGTRPRAEEAQEDKRRGEELVSSKKDRAENVMIVDLMRNDLTRFCEAGSVHVEELCALHSYSSVHHLVSTVRGRLAREFTPMEGFLSAFPAGSITGAPKLRSMEWIASKEATPRGAYTGSMFYRCRSGRLDSNVLIRTVELVEEELAYGAGGAVVADSEPAEEYREARWKARPFFDLLGEDP